MNRSPRRSFLPSAALLLLGAGCLMGCQEDIAAPPGRGYPFSIYGVLSPDLDVQSLLVFPVEDFPRLRAPEPLDAVVTSTDRNTGEVRTWRDSLVVDPAGHYEHVFWSDFQAEFDHTYWIEVARPSDGARSFAEVSIPLPVTLQFDESSAPALRVTIQGNGARVLKPEVTYVAQYRGLGEPGILPGDTVSYVASYEGEEREVENGWEIDILMGRDRLRLQDRYLPESTVFCFLGAFEGGFTLKEMWLDLIVGDPTWNPPGGILDPDALSHPGMMTNVQNGFGFVGGGYRVRERLHPSREATEKACFF